VVEPDVSSLSPFGWGDDRCTLLLSRKIENGKVA
jgi:hypothetical protein